MLADLRPHGFLTVYGMNHSTESAVAISCHLCDDERAESTSGRDIGAACFSDTSSTSPLLATFEMGDGRVDRASGDVGL